MSDSKGSDSPPQKTLLMSLEAGSTLSLTLEREGMLMEFLVDPGTVVTIRELFTTEKECTTPSL